MRSVQQATSTPWNNGGTDAFRGEAEAELLLRGARTRQGDGTHGRSFDIFALGAPIADLRCGVPRPRAGMGIQDQTSCQDAA